MNFSLGEPPYFLNSAQKRDSLGDSRSLTQGYQTPAPLGTKVREPELLGFWFSLVPILLQEDTSEKEVHDSYIH